MLKQNGPKQSISNLLLFSSWVASLENPGWEHTTNRVWQYGSELHEEWS